MRPVLLGLPLGIAGALAAGRVLASLLYQIGPRNPLVMLIVAAVLRTVALGACFLPARRAAGASPLEATRCE